MKSQSVRIAAILAILMLMIPVVQSGPLRAAEPLPLDLRGSAAAYGPRGDLWVVWSAVAGQSSDLFYSRRSADGWSPVGSIYRDDTTWDEAPSLAFDAAGVAWVAWSSSTGSDDTLYLSHWTGRAWSAPIAIPAGDTAPNRQPVLAAAPEGGLWLAWVGFDGNDDEIYAAFWDGTSWSEPQRISGDDVDPAAYDSQPQIAAGRDGSVWVAWNSYEKFLDDEIYAARWDGQRWLPEQRVSVDRDAVAASPSVAVGGDGGAWIAWHSSPDVEELVGRRIHLRAWSVADGWGQEEIVSSSPESYVDETKPCLALDDADRLHVTWRVTGGVEGQGYRAFDGRDWTPARLGVPATAAGSVCLPGSGAPTLLWWPDGEPAVLPHSADLAGAPLPLLPEAQAPVESRDVTIQLVINRHLAFGDSITWGQFTDPATGQLVGDYPARLSQKLNGRVVPSEVINDGVPSERVKPGRFRLTDVSWPMYKPQFLELMEGTNDITHTDAYNDIAFYLDEMVKYVKATGTRVFLSTLIPRQDNRYDETQTMNGYIANVAAKRAVPLVDNWQAFHNSGNWQALMVDYLHPNGTGMQVLADTWYASILTNISWLTEDTEPPQTWIESLPATSECTAAQVQWNGTDNISEQLEFDVQIQKNGGLWTDWLMATLDKSGTYTAGQLGDSLGFRVRGRDMVGNQSDYSAPKYTSLVDSAPPYGVGMAELPAVQKAPFTLSWWGEDACSAVTFDVQCSAGSSTNWQTWLSGVSYTSASFDPETAPCGPPQYGKSYYFRTIARDQAGRTTTSASVSTIVAKYTLAGGVFDIRHQPVAGASVDVDPAPLAAEPRPAGFRAYLAGAGDYEVSASRSGFGLLPPMPLQVAGDVDDADLVLPPHDDVVSNGGFEGGLAGWTASGAVLPELINDGQHTGSGAVKMGGLGGISQLGQPISVPPGLSSPTLSFLVRLDEGTSDDSSLQIELAGASISHTTAVSSAAWTHVWFPVDAALGQTVNLTFTVSNAAAIRLDEVSLGSSGLGGTLVNLPVVLVNHE